jgi:hypothetical protein
MFCMRDVKYNRRSVEVEPNVADSVTPSSLSILMATIRVQKSVISSGKGPVSSQLDFVRVGGRYRVGKLLGTGGSGEPH